MAFTENPLRKLSTCTGLGRLDAGVERTTGPLRPVAYVEIEAVLIQNLLAGMEKGMVAPAPVWTDIKTFPWRKFRGLVDILIGGYPCQPFSTAGQRKGCEDPRHLWPYYKRGIPAIRPLCIWFENVSGHLTLGFEEVANDLREMGYALESGIFTAEEIGAPHKRARLFILGFLADSTGKPCREAQERFGRYARRTDRTSSEMAHADSIRSRTDAGGVECQGEENESKAQRQEWDEIQRQWGRGYIGNDGSTLANGISPGLEERGEQSAWVELQTPQRGCDVDRWPAAPGIPQFGWECPRTIESGLGCTFDGYNFREDLLRALGNGVVEQTAELAFRNLLRKHFIS